MNAYLSHMICCEFDSCNKDDKTKVLQSSLLMMASRGTTVNPTQMYNTFINTIDSKEGGEEDQFSHFSLSFFVITNHHLNSTLPSPIENHKSIFFYYII